VRSMLKSITKNPAAATPHKDTMRATAPKDSTVADPVLKDTVTKVPVSRNRAAALIPIPTNRVVPTASALKHRAVAMAPRDRVAAAPTPMNRAAAVPIPRDRTVASILKDRAAATAPKGRAGAVPVPVNRVAAAPAAKNRAKATKARVAPLCCAAASELKVRAEATSGRKDRAVAAVPIPKNKAAVAPILRVRAEARDSVEPEITVAAAVPVPETPMVVPPVLKTITRVMTRLLAVKIFRTEYGF